MIYDRTIEDVNTALEIVENKIKAFQTLTEDDITALERGYFTLTTANRIEDKQKEVCTALANEGYYVQSSHKTWTDTDIFHAEDLTRISSISGRIRKLMTMYDDTPEPPKASFYYTEINKIEKILVDIETLITDLIGRERECNTFYCGEENLL